MIVFYIRITFLKMNFIINISDIKYSMKKAILLCNYLYIEKLFFNQ